MAQRALLREIEGHCLNRAFCWVKNKTLARSLDLTTRMVQYHIRALEAAGVIIIVRHEWEKLWRLGIVLAKRTNPDLPVVDPGDTEMLVEIRRFLIDRYVKWRPQSGYAADPESSHSKAKESSHSKAKESSPKKEVVVVERNHQEELGSEDGGIPIPSRQRQRPEEAPVSPELKASPQAKASGTEGQAKALSPGLSAGSGLKPPRAPQAPPLEPAQPRPAAPQSPKFDLTPSQQAYLAGLSPDRRARFDELGEREQRAVLKPHTDAICTVDLIVEDAERFLRSVQAQPVEQPPPNDRAELWHGLQGGPMKWAQVAAEDLVRSFGGDRDRKLWGEFHRVALAVQSGKFPADDVLDALRQGKNPKAKVPGAVFYHALKAHGWGK